MRLIYDRMEIKDFKSIRQLKFNWQRSPGLYFIEGFNEVEPELESNGAGKSTLFDALCWLQFGKTPDGLKGNDLIPWSNGQAPSGSLVIHQDQRKRIIQRSSNPNRLLLDNQDIVQEALEHELRINFPTFCHTILLPQGHPLFLDLTAGQKLSLLSDALDLERWDQRAERASQEERALARETERAYAQIESMTKQGHEIEEIRKGVEKQSKEWEQRLEQQQASVEKDLGELRKSLWKVENRRDTADLALDGAVIELRSIDKSLQQISDYLRINGEEVARIKAAVELKQQQLEHLRGGNCPLCGQTLTKTVRQQLKQETKELESTLLPLEGTRKDLLQQQDTLRKSAQEFTAKKNDARDELDRFAPQVAELKAKIDILAERQKQDAEQTNPFRNQLREMLKRSEKLQSELKQRTADWRKDLERRSHLEYWAKGFRDIKLNIIEDLLRQLEMCCNLMLEQSGLAGWKLEFAIERETQKGTISRGIDVNVRPYQRQVEKRVKFENWSGGEAQRLRLVAALALSDVLLARAGVDPSLGILDEPTRGLSPGGVDDLGEMLASFAEGRGRCVLLADQVARESALFQGVLTVTRSKSGGTAVVPHP